MGRIATERSQALRGPAAAADGPAGKRDGRFGGGEQCGEQCRRTEPIARGGLQLQAHHRQIEPAAELGADFAGGADQFEAEALVERDRGGV